MKMFEGGSNAQRHSNHPFPLFHHHLETECEDNWTWNLEKNCCNVYLKGPERRTVEFHPNWSMGSAGVRGTKPLTQGKHYWEIHVNEKVYRTSIMFGIGTGKTKLHADRYVNLLGENNQSWGLSHKGFLWHDGKFCKYTEPFRSGTPVTIGILFDGINGTLNYYKDGVNLGIAFSDLKKIKEPIYPIVCRSASKTEMTLASTKRTSNSLQDYCRASILSYVIKEEHINDLELPKTLQQFVLKGGSWKTKEHLWINPYIPRTLTYSFISNNQNDI